MTENEIKVIAYKQAIIAMVKGFSDFENSETFISCLKVLFGALDLAEFCVDEDKAKTKKEAANNELGE